jgi:hypothetical protein
VLLQDEHDPYLVKLADTHSEPSLLLQALKPPEHVATNLGKNQVFKWHCSHGGTLQIACEK